MGQAKGTQEGERLLVTKYSTLGEGSWDVRVFCHWWLMMPSGWFG